MRTTINEIQPKNDVNISVDNRNLIESSRKKKITTETFNNFYKVLYFIVSSSRMSKSIYKSTVIIMLQLKHFHVGIARTRI